MAQIIEITDIRDSRLDVFARLTEAQLRSRQQPEQSIFIAESGKVIRLALAAGLKPVSLLMEQRQIQGQEADIIAACGDIPLYTAARETLSALTGYALTRGMLCAFRRPAPLAAETLLTGGRRIAVLENIADSTNIGAIFRSAAALNVDAVLLTPCCCDPLCRRAVRVSMGTVFQIPWARLGESAADWPAKGIALLREHGFATAALALDDRSLPIDDPRPATEKKLALLLGTEGDGLSRQTITACDYTLRIPMSHQVDSLNVAAASAVAFWQLCR